MLKTPANPGGLPRDVFNGLRAASLADRAKLYMDFADVQGLSRCPARLCSTHKDLVNEERWAFVKA